MKISNGMKKALFTLSFVFFLTPIFFAFAQMPIKILLVPGHDDTAWGAQYGNLKEADMNLVLAKQLFNILKKDKRFEVHITRDGSGYTKEFSAYFSKEWSNINLFLENAKKEMQNKIERGEFIEKELTPHNAAIESMATVLYGINKWANENGTDAVIHIHFNDYPRPNKWTVGDYKGFAIYMPEEQMVNSKESVNLAQSILKQLRKKYITSTYEKELGGLIPDQKLIALGANDTLFSCVRSVLIEYGYIYRFRNSVMRHRVYTNMANLTATGIKKYFFLK